MIALAATVYFFSPAFEEGRVNLIPRQPPEECISLSET